MTAPTFITIDGHKARLRRRRTRPEDIDTNTASLSRWRVFLGKPPIEDSTWEVEKRRQHSVKVYKRERRRRP
jgi:hypothetical protein